MREPSKPVPLVKVHLKSIPFSTYVLALGQAINLLCAVLSVTVSALAGYKLASEPKFATIPYGLQFLAVMVFSYPASLFMRRYGRKTGFAIGPIPLILSGIVGYSAIAFSNFVMLCVAHFFLGAYTAFANFYRFAAVDNLDRVLKPKAFSLVVSGGVLAAIIGPALAVRLQSVTGYQEYSLCYAAFVIFGFLALFLTCFLTAPPLTAIPVASESKTKKPLSFALFFGIFAAASGYFIMNLLMVQASLVMNGAHIHFTSSAIAIQIHVLAMFAPAFVTGHLISQFGIRTVLVAGFFFLTTSALVGLASPRYENLLVGLILLGLGWNFTYVGGGALLSEQVSQTSSHRWQGINDTAIAVCATLGAFTPSILLSLLGREGSNFLCLFIACIGGLICLGLKKQVGG